MTTELDNYECYEDLANAIILRAIEDYRQACEVINRSQDKFILSHAKSEKERIIRFVNSEYYESLTSVPRGVILMKLKDIEKKVMKGE